MTSVSHRTHNTTKSSEIREFISGEGVEIHDHRKLITSLITTKTVTAAESGTTFILNLAAGFTCSLPTPASGLYYNFIVGIAPTTAYIVKATSNGSTAANIAFAVTASAEDAAGHSGSANSAADLFSFVADKAVVGDQASCICDGTNWYWTGFCTVQDAFTLA